MTNTNILLPHTSHHPNLYVSGMTPEGRPRLHANIPGLEKHMSVDQDTGGPGELYMADISRLCAQTFGPVGIVQIDLIDPQTGYLKERTFTHNVETDNGVLQLLHLFGSGSVPSQAKYMLLDTNTIWSTTAGTVASSTVYSGSPPTITVLQGNNPCNTGIVAGNASASYVSNATTTPGVQAAYNASTYTGVNALTGTGIIWSIGVVGRQEVISGNATVGSFGTTAIALTSAYTTTVAHNVNDYIVASPSTTDGPYSGPTGTTYVSPAIDGSSNGTLVFSGTGIRGRQVAITYVFPASSTFAGSFTSLWMVTNTAWQTTGPTSAFAHATMQPQNINANTAAQVTYTAQF